MPGFVQVFEFKTSHIDEVRALGQEIQTARGGKPGGPQRVIVTEDRDRPGTYINIVQFASYDEAMANSDDPQTQAFAKRMGELCDGPPRFYNLDLLQSWPD
jgi:quinol monooxygenase YgiN